MAKKVTAKSKQKKAVTPPAKTETKKIQGVSERTFKDNIRNALRAQGRYTPEYDLAINLAAHAMHLESRACSEIRGLDHLTVVKVTKYGENLDEHPTLKTQRSITAEVRRWLEVLGLTADGIVNKLSDEMDDFDRQVNGE